MKNRFEYQIAVLFLFAVFLLAGCSNKNALTVTTNYKPIAYEQLKTYRWYDKAQKDTNSKISEIVRDYIHDAIDRELAAKGLSLQNGAKVDFYVNFHVTAETQVDIKDYNVYSGTTAGYTWHRYTGFQADIQAEQKSEYIYHREGSLIIDIINPATDKLIWRGIARKRLTKELNQQQREKMINQAVAAVLADFPPRTK